jgi:hypothetical protein
MNGISFIQYLKTRYKIPGEILINQYSFNKWLCKSDQSISLQFNGCTPKKSVPQKWLITAKNHKNKGVTINRRWFIDNFQVNDCRVKVAIWLISNH